MLQWAQLCQIDLLLSPTNQPSLLQLHKQQSQAEPERHVWHRRESDDSGESAPEEGGEAARAPQPIPRSASYPCATPRPGAPETTALHGGFQRRYGGITGIQRGIQEQRSFREGWFFQRRDHQDGIQRLTLHVVLKAFPLFLVFSCLYRSWHSAPCSLSLLQAAPGRMGRRWAASIKTPRAGARGGLRR